MTYTKIKTSDVRSMLKSTIRKIKRLDKIICDETDKYSIGYKKVCLNGYNYYDGVIDCCEALLNGEDITDWVLTDGIIKGMENDKANRVYFR